MVRSHMLYARVVRYMIGWQAYMLGLSLYMIG